MNISHNKIIERPRSNRKKTIFQIAISLLIIVLLFIFLPIPVILNSMKRISLIEWSLYLFIGLFIHVLGVFKWRLQLKAVHISLGFVNTVRFYAAGMFANVFMPSIIGGDVLRSSLVIRQTGRKRDVILSGLIDRLYDIMSLCFLAVFGSFFISDSLDTQGYMILMIAIIGLVGAIMSGIGLLFYRPSIWWPKRLRRQAIRLRVALWRIVNNYKLALIALLLSLLLQICVVLLSATLGKAIGIELPLMMWFFVWPLAKITAILPISFGGIGVQELTLVGLMKSLGVTPALALAQGFLWRGMIVVNGLNSAMIWLILNRVDAKQLKHSI